MKRERTVGIHDGTFHADEVTACALLVLFDQVDVDKIIRTRDPKMLDTCAFVCDVGGEYDPAQRLFDHHQVSYQGPLSSAGMILLYLKDQKILSETEYGFFNGSLVAGVDAHDNGKANQEYGQATFSHIIANFNPVNYDSSEEELSLAFAQALEFAAAHLKRLHERFLYSNECRVIVKEVMARDRLCLHFDQALPWLESFFALDGEHHPAKFVVMPAGEHWKLRGIPPDYAHRMQVRIPLPEDWAGLLGEELQEKSGIKGAVFCHKGRFTSVWETREDALKALEKVLTMKGLNYEDAL